MSEHITNEEIREKLKKLNYNCGPITGTTREVYLKKLEALIKESGDFKNGLPEKITDEELRMQLISLGYSPGPINAQNRGSYFKKLENLKLRGIKSNTEVSFSDKNKKKFNNMRKFDINDCFDEPMDID